MQEAGLAAARAAADRQGEAVLLVGLGRHRATQEEWGPARSMLDSARSMFRSLRDDHGAAHADWVLSYLDRLQGRRDDALVRCHRNATVFESAGDRYGQAHALRGIGQILLQDGAHAQALTFLERALSVAEAGGAAWPRMCMLRWVADAQLTLGRHDEAHRGFTEILDHTRASGDVAGQTAAHVGLGKVALARGDVVLLRGNRTWSQGV
ncbi:tetratricopeptide repeat protein [Streptomyces netropsis]|uniref:Tetratricopeptide (TPR) repeat protein n=1 Tax=Streptomyces netropsis TaxID=55404 RepID=A0A7W7LE01_STRNE|nr:tetratricopeptide repeat protein [Streptomyces netropsis]MBB4888217.1 tetratricopeptide (TPR) repeat protein [Streptomyces netropsis]GGR31216.1 hypothetical protein GCM10010219_39830 [Streptomyces netropsis]